MEKVKKCSPTSILCVFSECFSSTERDVFNAVAAFSYFLLVLRHVLVWREYHICAIWPKGLVHAMRACAEWKRWCSRLPAGLSPILQQQCKMGCSWSDLRRNIWDALVLNQWFQWFMSNWRLVGIESSRFIVKSRLLLSVSGVEMCWSWINDVSGSNPDAD